MSTESPGSRAGSAAPIAWTPETFVDELCKHLVATEGYAVLGTTEGGQVRPLGIRARDGFAWRVATGLPALEPLARAFDRVLVRSDGYSLEVLCLQDRLAQPERRVAIGLDELRAAAAGCVPEGAGRAFGARPAVLIRIWEVGAPADHRHLEGLRQNPARDRVGVSAAAFGPDADRVWTNGALLGSWAQASTARRALRAVRAGEAPIAPTDIGHAGRRPIATWTILAVLVAVYVLQVTLGEWSEPFTPSLRSLVAFGALYRDLVFAGQWYRVASAAFLHGSPFHLLMNGIALYFGGTLLERLIGRGWFLTVYGLSALGGGLASLFLSAPGTVSVGASGAIMGIFGAALAVSYRMPYGGARSWVQSATLRVLVPSLMPLFLFRNGPRIDFWAHLGGAAAGALVGVFLLRTWPPSEPHPRHRRLAAVLAAACALVLGGALAMALVERPEILRQLSAIE